MMSNTKTRLRKLEESQQQLLVAIPTELFDEDQILIGWRVKAEGLELEEMLGEGDDKYNLQARLWLRLLELSTAKHVVVLDPIVAKL